MAEIHHKIDLLQKANFRNPANLLDELHNAAYAGDLSRYFGCFAKNSRFLGTDPHENWRAVEFLEFCRPHFDGTKPAWIYRPIDGSRKIDIHDINNFATFDELLDSESFLCISRGTGALVKLDDYWFVSLYHLSFPVPNDLAKETCKQFATFQEKSSLARKTAASDEAASQLLAEIELGEEMGPLKGEGVKTGQKKQKNKKK